MLRLIREAGFARALVLVAGLLAVSASFGLHPEPASGRAPAPAWSSGALGAPASHACPACLAQRQVSIARLTAIVLQVESSVPAPAVPELARPDRLAARPQRDRAPPVAS
jgi:predicted component of type VI protein secretion system